jgi:threonine aldolase
MATRLADGLTRAPWADLVNQPDGNILFARFCTATDAALKAAGARYAARPEGETHVIARLVTAFDTTAEDVDAFVAVSAQT